MVLVVNLQHDGGYLVAATPGGGLQALRNGYLGRARTHVRTQVEVPMAKQELHGSNEDRPAPVPAPARQGLKAGACPLQARYHTPQAADSLTSLVTAVRPVVPQPLRVLWRAGSPAPIRA
jgi:hypothetical protein